jgi:probable addiction module antidote protein
MPIRNHNQDLKARLASKEYASLYLETAFRESCLDHNWAAFGLALRNVIEAQNKDVAQFAKNSGVSRQHLYLLFGKKANPTLNTLVQILEELDLSIGILPQSDKRRKFA